jgi:DNA-binding NtrC family response regulator
VRERERAFRLALNESSVDQTALPRGAASTRGDRLFDSGTTWAVETIALLDDDDDLRSLLTQLFELELGCQCVDASSVAKFKEQAPQVLRTELAILDINLGNGLPSGFDAYEWLRENGYSGRVVFLTGHARNHPLLRKAAEFPNVEVLEKPVTVERLLQLLPPRPPLETRHA